MLQPGAAAGKDAEIFNLQPSVNLAGDLFDEFNVPNHEWMAYKQFVDSFYMKTEVLGAVNNYYQVAFKIID